MSNGIAHLGSRRRVLTPISAMVVALTSACTSPKVLRMYSGNPRPESEVATVRGCGLRAIDGEPIAPGCVVAHVAPGSHTLHQVWSETPLSIRVSAGKTAVPLEMLTRHLACEISIVVEAGKSYAVEMVYSGHRTPVELRAQDVRIQSTVFNLKPSITETVGETSRRFTAYECACSSEKGARMAGDCPPCGLAPARRAPLAREARLCVYRNKGLWTFRVRPEVELNYEVVGRSTPGGFFYVDRPAGSYTVRALFAAQTMPQEPGLTFSLGRGETKYVRVSALIGARIRFELVDAAEAAAEIASLEYTGTEPAASASTACKGADLPSDGK